jgi:hypothetical protein
LTTIAGKLPDTGARAAGVRGKSAGQGLAGGDRGFYRVRLSEETASMVRVTIIGSPGGKAVQATQYRAVADNCGAR